jgi:hypothetical protein
MNWKANRDLARKARARADIEPTWRLMFLTALDYGDECTASYLSLANSIGLRSERSARRCFERLDGDLCDIEKRPGKTDRIRFRYEPRTFRCPELPRTLGEATPDTQESGVSDPTPDIWEHDPGHLDEVPRTLGGHTPDSWESDERKNVKENVLNVRESARARAKPQTRMKDDWLPDACLVAELLNGEQEYSEEELERETPKFRDHFLANGKPMTDWSAAFRNWMRRSREYARSNGRGRHDEPSPIQSALNEVMREARGGDDGE